MGSSKRWIRTKTNSKGKITTFNFVNTSFYRKKRENDGSPRKEFSGKVSIRKFKNKGERGLNTTTIYYPFLDLNKKGSSDRKNISI